MERGNGPTDFVSLRTHRDCAASSVTGGRASPILRDRRPVRSPCSRSPSGSSACAPESLDRDRGQRDVLALRRSRTASILLRAFLLVGRVHARFGDVITRRSRHSTGKPTMQAFLTRNSRPSLPSTSTRMPRSSAARPFPGHRQRRADHDLPREIVLGRPTNRQDRQLLLNASLITAPGTPTWSSSGPKKTALSAAVYSASEGLDVLLLETNAPGRPGRCEFENRELPGLSDGHFRAGSRHTCVHAGAEVRGATRYSTSVTMQRLSASGHRITSSTALISSPAVTVSSTLLRASHQRCSTNRERSWLKETS